MAVAESLFQLEQHDAQLERREAELREIRQRRQRNRELEAAQARLERLRSEEQTAAAGQHALELELSTLESKITRDRTRMYGGQIVDPRELASLEKELEHYSAQRDALEEQVLLAMERLEGLQESAASAAGDVEELRQRWEVDRPALQRREEELAGSLTQLQAEREALAASLDPSALELYRRLRAGSGHAVSHVTDGICQWCRVAIPPKDVQHARGGALVTCTNCARILYAGS